MNFSKDHSEFLARFQDLLFSSKLKGGTPREKADLLRNTIAHLQYAQLTGMIDETSVRPLLHQYESMYTSVVDCFDETTGLNNYADGALALCSGKKNESKEWKSSLTVDSVLAMPCVQQHIKKAQGAQEKVMPLSKRSELLPLKSIENASLSYDRSHTNGGSNLPNRKLQQDGNQANRVMSIYGNQSANNRADMAKSGSRSSYEGNQNQSRDSRSFQKPLFSVTQVHPKNSLGLNGLRDNWPTPREKGPSDIPKIPDRSSTKTPVSQEILGRQAFGQYGSRSNSGVPDRYESSAGTRATMYSHPQTAPYQPDMMEEEERTPAAAAANVFKTARQQLAIDQQKKYGGGAGGGAGGGSVNTAAYGTGKKSLGTRRGLNSKFVPPVMNRDEEDGGNRAADTITRAVLKTGGGNSGTDSGSKIEGMDEEKLKGVEAKMVEMIMNEIMDSGPPLTWDDIAGLEFAKKTIKEIVVWPMLRPDIFTGLRGPPKGLLLFGPPGTGKTLIGKCIASQSKSTFFCISASSLTSKWVGEGEKMVRALFAVARAQQPAVVFIDEIDSLLTQRTDGENEASRRIKTEFLVQLDGASTSAEDKILVIGATNRPQEIDEAARRRFVKRLYIPLPEQSARKTIIVNLLRQQAHQLSEDELDGICIKTHGFSGADMASLCREAALGPIRDMSFGDIEHIAADQVRAITYTDFVDALHHVRPSVSERDLDQYLEWNNTYGSGSR